MNDLYQTAYQFQTYLHERGFRSSIIGGIAISIWGEPRFTQDIDFKILLNRVNAHQLIGRIEKTYQFLSENPVEDIRKTGFIFLKTPEGVRIDLLLAETSFDAQVIKRSISIEIQTGVSLKICTPEDLIIYKMISTRARDHEDVEGILIRQKKLDHAYVFDWLKQFEMALDDSTLIREYKSLIAKYHSPKS